MLSILRMLPMMRTVIVALLFAVLLGVSANAATRQKSQTQKHATAAHSAQHKARSSSAHKAKRSRHKARKSATHSKKSASKRSVSKRKKSVAHRSKSTTHRSKTVAHRKRTSRRTRPEPAAYTRTRRQPVPPPDSDTSDMDNTTPQPVEHLPGIDATPTDALLRSTKIVPVAPLRGSMESLVRQNLRTDEDHLERIRNNDDLNDRIARGMLVPVPTSSALTINQNLPENRRYCRPWTATFLRDLARAHDAIFHSSLNVSSAVRTVRYQKRLINVNGNAAAAEGEIVSPHVTGATIDISKHGMSAREIYWMRGRLLALQNEGKLDVEEEFRQACFHITVYKSYVSGEPERAPRRRVARPTPLQDDNGDDVEPAVGIASNGR